MAIITLKCINCGDNMYTDDSKQKAFCGSCGAENLIMQDVVNIYNTMTNTTNYHTQQTINKTIIGKEQNEAEDYIRIANEFLSLGVTEKARENFQKAIDLNPTDYRGWFGLGQVKSASLTLSDDTTKYLEKALKLAPEDELIMIKKELVWWLLYTSKEESLMFTRHGTDGNKNHAQSAFKKALAIAQEKDISEIISLCDKYSFLLDGFWKNVEFDSPQVKETLKDLHDRNRKKNEKKESER